MVFRRHTVCCCVPLLLTPEHTRPLHPGAVAEADHCEVGALGQVPPHQLLHCLVHPPPRIVLQHALGCLNGNDQPLRAASNDSNLREESSERFSVGSHPGEVAVLGHHLLLGAPPADLLLPGQLGLVHPSLLLLPPVKHPVPLLHPEADQFLPTDPPQGSLTQVDPLPGVSATNNLLNLWLSLPLLQLDIRLCCSSHHGSPISAEPTSALLPVLGNFEEKAVEVGPSLQLAVQCRACICQQLTQLLEDLPAGVRPHPILDPDQHVRVSSVHPDAHLCLCFAQQQQQPQRCHSVHLDHFHARLMFCARTPCQEERNSRSSLRGCPATTDTPGLVEEARLPVARCSQPRLAPWISPFLTVDLLEQRLSRHRTTGHASTPGKLQNRLSA